MVYNYKDQPTIPRQDSKPGTTHHYRRTEVHIHHIHGANHRYTTSTTETTNKSPSSRREIQVPPRSSHEGVVEGRTKNRIKRSSLTHEVKKLQKEYPAVLTISTLPLSKQDFTNPCENTTSEIQIKTTILNLTREKNWMPLSDLALH